MDRQTLEEQLQRSNAGDEEAITELAEAHKLRSYQAIRSATEIWLERWNSSRPAAEALLVEYQELAIRPLMEAQDTVAPIDLAWLLDTVVTAELELRAKMLRRLENLMQDKSPIEQVPIDEPIEEPVPELRVCDEAYLQARRLAGGESAEQRILNEDAFLQSAFDERDKVIKQYLQSRVWTDLMDGMDEYFDD
jgi:hypothetical protein